MEHVLPDERRVADRAGAAAAGVRRPRWSSRTTPRSSAGSPRRPGERSTRRTGTWRTSPRRIVPHAARRAARPTTTCTRCWCSTPHGCSVARREDPHDDADVDRHGLPQRDADREAARLRRRPGSTGSRSSSPTWWPHRPARRRSAALAGRLGLTLDLYQPFRDAEGVDRGGRSATCSAGRGRSSPLMQRLGIDTMLVCSNVGTATVDDDEVSAAQLRRLGEEAAAYGVRLAYEALAWGRFVDDYRRAWRIVELADHPPSASASTASTSSPAAMTRRAIEDDPRREDLLPAARRRPGAHPGRAVLEPAPPAVPG